MLIKQTKKKSVPTVILYIAPVLVVISIISAFGRMSGYVARITVGIVTIISMYVKLYENWAKKS